MNRTYGITMCREAEYKQKKEKAKKKEERKKEKEVDTKQ